MYKYRSVQSAQEYMMYLDTDGAMCVQSCDSVPCLHDVISYNVHVQSYTFNVHIIAYFVSDH